MRYFDGTDIGRQALQVKNCVNPAAAPDSIRLVRTCRNAKRLSF